MLDNIHMAAKDMLDTKYLFQPRGPRTAYLFRMPTPAVLVGRINPRTGAPYGREIRESLKKGGVAEVTEARRLRDLRLGEIRLEEARAITESSGSMEEALEIASSLRDIPNEEREDIELALGTQAEALEKKLGEKKAVRWFKVATGHRTPFDATCKSYVADAGKALSYTYNFSDPLP